MSKFRIDILFLEELEVLACNTDIDSWLININDDNIDDDNDNVNNLEDCEEGVYFCRWRYWMKFLGQSLIVMETKLFKGAPFAGCVNLPADYSISLVDSFGDGWNGNFMYIDGLGEFSLEAVIKI